MSKTLNKSLSKQARKLILKQNLTEEEVEVLDKEVVDTGSNGENAVKHENPIGSNAEKSNVKEDDETDKKDVEDEKKDKVEEDEDTMAKVRAAKGKKDGDKGDDDSEDKKDKVEEDADSDEKDDEDDKKDEVKEADETSDKFDWDDDDLKEDHEELTKKSAEELGHTGTEPAKNNDSDVKVLDKVAEEADDDADDEDDKKDKVEEESDNSEKDEKETSDKEKADAKKDKEAVKESAFVSYRKSSKTAAEKKSHKKQIKEAVAALFKGTDVSAEFIEKAELVFEAALNKRVLEEAKAIDKIARKAVQRRVTKVKGILEGKIDAYLGRVVKEWMTENTIAVETGIRVELAESFLNQMKVLFENHNIEVPANKVNLVEEQQKTIVALTEKVNQVTDKLLQSKQELFEAQKLEVLADLSDGLAATQVVRLQKLVEDVEAKDLDSYKKKVLTIKENFFAGKEEKANKINEETVTASDDVVMNKLLDSLANRKKD